VLTASILLLASCGGVGGPPIPGASTGKSASSGKLSSQSVQVPASGYISGAVYHSVVSDPTFQRALQELGLYGSPENLIDWQNSRQIIEDSSDMYEDRFTAEVYVTLKDDVELTFKGSWYYIGGGNATDHSEWGSLSRALKIHPMGSKVIFLTGILTRIPSALGWLSLTIQVRKA